MQSFTHFPPRERIEPPETNRPDPSIVPGAALLSRGVSIKGSVKFLNELLLDDEVEGTIVSTGTLRIGEHARFLAIYTAEEYRAIPMGWPCWRSCKTGQGITEVQTREPSISGFPTDIESVQTARKLADDNELFPLV